MFRGYPRNCLLSEQTLPEDYVGAAPGVPMTFTDPPHSPRGRWDDGIPPRPAFDPGAGRVEFALAKTRELEGLGVVAPGPATAPSPRTPERRGNTPGERCREAWRLADANPAMTVRELAAVLHVYPSRVKSWLAIRDRRGSAA